MLMKIIDVENYFDQNDNAGIVNEIKGKDDECGDDEVDDDEG